MLGRLLQVLHRESAIPGCFVVNRNEIWRNQETILISNSRSDWGHRMLPPQTTVIAHGISGAIGARIQALTVRLICQSSEPNLDRGRGPRADSLDLPHRTLGIPPCSPC